GAEEAVVDAVDVHVVDREPRIDGDLDAAEGAARDLPGALYGAVAAFALDRAAAGAAVRDRVPVHVEGAPGGAVHADGGADAADVVLEGAGVVGRDARRAGEDVEGEGGTAGEEEDDHEKR